MYMYVYMYMYMYLHMQNNFMENCLSFNSLSSLRIWALKYQGLQEEAVYLILLVKKVKMLRAGQNDEIQIEL